MTTTDRPLVLHARVVTGAGGGPEKTILNSPRFLARHGYDAVCAYLHPPRDPGFPELRRRGTTAGARVESVPDRGPFDWSVVRRLLALCRRERVAIWHGHDYKSNVLGLLLRRWWPMRLVSTVHGWVNFTRRSWLYYGIDRLSLRQYERVVCVSPDLVERCRRAGVPGDRCSLLDNAIDLESCRRRRSRDVAKAEFGVPPGRTLIGAVGRLADEKGFDHLVDAVADLARRGRDVHLLIAGEGAEKERLARQIDEAGLGDRIQLLGHVARPQDLYEALDVFTLSSLREGLPNVVLEAMGNGVPVVSTHVGGLPRLVEDELNGLVVPPSDAPALTAALDRVVTDHGLRTRLGDAGRRTIEERFSFDRRMQRMAAIYDDLLAERPLRGQRIR